MTDFYLISGELVIDRQFEPRACTVLRRLRSSVRDDLALVRVDPPIPKEVGYDEEDVSKLVLAGHFRGKSLFPVSEWPVHVYIGRLKYKKGEPIPDDVADNLVMVDWGILYPTREQAQATLRLSLGDIGGRKLW